MRRVPGLSGEPTSLQAYRAAHPADDSCSGDEAQAAWSRFRDDEAYAIVRDALVAAQGGLCMYCEQRLTHEDGRLVTTDQQVEHVLAKSGDVGRTLAWTNLGGCCVGGTWPHHTDRSRYLKGTRKKPNTSCGQTKNDLDLPVGCDPRSFPLSSPRLVRIDLDGTMRPEVTACAQHGIDPTNLKEAIDKTLGLNCDRLRLARSKLIDELKGWAVAALKLLLQEVSAPAAQQEEFLKLYAGLRLQPDAHGHLRRFWTTERQYLEPYSDQWIAQHIALPSTVTSVAPSST